MTREAFSGVFVFVTFCNSCNYNNANTGNCQRHLVNLRNFIAMHKLGRVFLVFYDKYVRLCNSVNKTPSAVAMEIGLQKSTVTRWSKGTKPNYATAQKVADYFGGPVEELIEKKKDKFPSDKVVDILVKASETKKAPTQEGEHELTGREIKAAFLGGLADGLSDEAIDRYWNDARGYIGYKIQQEKNKPD